MARACAKRSLENVRPQAFYMGFLSSEQKDVEAAITSTVWNHWDALPDSPPKQRPSPELAAPQNLQILSWAGGPVWPETIWKHFQPDSPEYQALQNQHKLFKEKFPSAVVLPAAGSESTTAVRRATGRPDYTIDGGAAPLDITRVVDTEKKTEAEFGAVTRTSYKLPLTSPHIYRCPHVDSRLAVSDSKYNLPFLPFPGWPLPRRRTTSTWSSQRMTASGSAIAWTKPRP